MAHGFSTPFQALSVLDSGVPVACGHCHGGEAHRGVLPLHGGAHYVDICIDSCLYMEGSRNLFGHIEHIPLVGYLHSTPLTELHCEAQHQAEAKC